MCSQSLQYIWQLTEYNSWKLDIATIYNSIYHIQLHIPYTTPETWHEILHPIKQSIRFLFHKLFIKAILTEHFDHLGHLRPESLVPPLQVVKGGLGHVVIVVLDVAVLVELALGVAQVSPALVQCQPQDWEKMSLNSSKCYAYTAVQMIVVKCWMDRVYLENRVNESSAKVLHFRPRLSDFWCKQSSKTIKISKF